MTIAEAGVIAALALADSTSIGTLVVPVWLMVSARAIPRRIVLYLGVLAAFYWDTGLILLLAGRCELCEEPAKVHVHQIRQLAQLAPPWPDQPAWAALMAKMLRNGG